MSKVLFPVALALLTFFLPLTGCSKPVGPQPPIAKKIPKVLVAHGDERIDNYYWLRERENPEVVSYLEAENAYTEAALAHTADLRNRLYDEIVGRIKPDDASVPVTDNGYVYTVRYVEGAEYPIHARHKGTLDAPEEILIDANQLAAGHSYFAVRGLAVSPDNAVLVFGQDTTGRRLYTLRFRNLETGELLSDEIPNVTGEAVWAADNRTVFYTRQDPETLRSHLVYRHTLGDDPDGDPVIYDETDETFSTSVFKTKSRRFIVIHSSSTLSDEARILRADDPTGEFRVFLPRQRGHEYSIDHLDGRFFIRTNDDAINFRLMSTDEKRLDRSSWQDVIPPDEATFLQRFELFRDHLVVAERHDGRLQLRVIPWDGSAGHVIAFPDPAYDVWLGPNPESDTSVVRFTYSSLTTPESVFDYDMTTRESTLLKREEILGGFDSADYVSERLLAPARDGVMVPISLVRRVDAPEGPAPLLLYGYGSYGYTIDPDFRSERLSLLDRGFTFAIAHVRGGQEFGRPWYEDGKLLKKKNTFNDFIDCARFLIDKGLTEPDRLFAMGGSAGGLLMGAVVNDSPELFRGAVAYVPFVDVVTTMLDEDIPLTTAEYDEWGNPNEEIFYRYMLSYSPYDQVRAQDYPAMLVTAGLHDSQVQYWEPAKWVAKLRALKTDANPLFLHVNMDAGHGGASGRYKQHEETALVYAFMLDQLGDESQAK